mgnify:CR=1 FL=1
MINFKQLANSFRYAIKGLKYVYQHEQNFQIQIFFFLVILILIIFLRVDMTRAAVLILVSVMVLILELLNTIAERVTDILQPRMHHYVEIIKDIMAASVLISSSGAVVVGILILWPYLSRLISR